MSDINNEKNVGFPEEENLDIDAIFGSDDGADAALSQIGDADIFASEEPDNASAVPDADAVTATDSETIPVNAEQDSASDAPDAETPESSVKTDADEVPAKENGNAPAKAERQTKDGDKNPKRKNTGKKAAKNAGKTEAAAQDAEGSLFDAFASDEADAPLPPTETETSADDSQPQSLFDKPPVFSYGGVKEPIGDASQTFEELRILKADDFPELGEGKSVSWKVKYGTVTKPVSDPKSATIASVKEEIEKSQTFLNALAKGKDKNPECLVIPSVIAKSKGIAAYKGVFRTLEEARQSGKSICLIPARNGKVYEMRKTEMGEMVVPKSRVAEFAEVRAGFVPALPRIPREVTERVISFFRSFMDEDAEYEALAFLYWDRRDEDFVVFIPQQRATKVSVYANLTDNCLPEERYLHYADIHSHNSMEAKFSAVDDRDEKATRLYIVIGRLNSFYPSVSARISCGGTYLPVAPELVMEGVGEEFPAEWLDKVERVPVRKGAAENETEEEWPGDAEGTPVPDCFGQIVFRVAPRELMEEL